VHASGVTWSDDSGTRLRQWLGLSDETLYDPRAIGILPMGFCYPGMGKSGDLPPRRECPPQWHDKLMAHLERVELTLLVGQYAQKEVLGKRRQRNLTETVRAWRDYGPNLLPLPHPAWRVRRWMGQQRWLEAQVVPALQALVATLLG
jgi:uracil-DNA glycosylase